MENNYNLVWSENGFKSVKDDYTTVDQEDEDTNI